MAGLRVVIVGSGFAGSILARILHRQGHDVALIERSAHPRFAIGESSTPLAAICLERLAQRYGLADLSHLAAYGRWLDHMPTVRRGLKRGFTFYGHRPHEPYRNDERNRRRLLVAASPHDSAADSHWLREDVDHFLVHRAEAEGVEYTDRVELTDLERRGRRFRLAGERPRGRVEFHADLVVDASGADGFLARHLPIGSRLDRVGLRTASVYGHFDGVEPFQTVAATEARFPPGPYPDERAAVHHMLDEGWMYELPFDHGVVSAGFVLEHEAVPPDLARLGPETAFRRTLARYPTLEARYASAEPVRPVACIARTQRRLERAAGADWALLPHAFCFLSPMFSTGIAWSLLAVERLALLLERHTGSRHSPSRLRTGLARYGELLDREADHLGTLIEGAYHARHDFDVFAAYTYLYFAAVSYSEAAQRLLPSRPQGGEWAWDGFLRSSDPTFTGILARAINLLATGRRSEGFAGEYFDAVRRLIAPRNVAGLADLGRERLYPIDFEALIGGANLLGLTADDVRRRLPRLRGH